MESNKISLGLLGTAQSFPVEAITMKGQIDTLAVDAVSSSVVIKETGVLTISTGTESASFNLHVAADAIVVEKAFGSASFTITKDNATTVNVYAEGGVVVFQNKTAAEVTLNSKSYV